MVKIVSLELENVKRVALVHLEPSAAGLTVIGGDNAQGKTSILDGICYALGGERFRPSSLQREGSSADARMELKLSNGLVVERKGKNAALKVTDPTGTKAGQRLLDSFVEELALDLPKFLKMTGKEKAGVLLRILGIEDKLAVLDKEERAAYDERTAQGRIADQKAKYAKEMPEHHDAPEAPVSAAELVAEAQQVMARNAERQAARAAIERLRDVVDNADTVNERKRKRVAELEAMLKSAVSELLDSDKELSAARANLIAAEQDPITADESTAEIQRRMDEIEMTNAKVRANLDKHKAIEDAKAAADEVAVLTAKVEGVRARRGALLAGAALPLPGLSIEAGELTYNGRQWDCMSSMERIRAGAAIVRALKPQCGFLLLDGLEAFDAGQLAELGGWLEAEGLQAIATRVSKGDECSVIIEDGLVVSTSSKKEKELEY